MYKVFIVDDEDVVREGLVEYIDWHSMGFEVIGSAMNGQEAFEFIKDNKVDLLVTDIRMPFMDGLELSAKTKRLHPETFIIVLSGHDEFDYAQKALKTGVSDYLLKPISSKELIKIMEKVKNKIDENFNNKKQIEKYKKQLRESLPLLKERFFNKLITINIGLDEIKKREKFLNIKLEGKPYLVSVYEIDAIDYENDFERKGIITLFLINKIKETAYGSKNKIIFNDKKDNVVVIFDEANKERIVNFNEFLISEFNKATGKKVTIGVGTVVNNIQEIKSSYEAACESIESKFILGTNKVIEFDDIKASNDIDTILISDIQKKVINFIKLNNIEKLNISINIYFKTLLSSSMPLEYIKLLLNEFISAMTRLLFEYEIPVEDIFGNEFSYYRILDEFDTLKEIKTWIIDKSLSIAKKINTSTNKKFSDVVENVKEFINANYMDYELNLKNSAKIFYVSHCYLSTIFKKETGESFIEYLTNIRIEKAKELLKTTDLKLYEIAKKTGFKDQYYFSSLFKKRVGVPPKAYKISLELDNFL